MNINKKTIVLLLLVVIGGGAAYFLFLKNSGEMSLPEPEKIAERIKIEVPAVEEKIETPQQQISVQTQSPPVVIPDVSTAEQNKEVVVKPAPEQANVEDKNEIKPVVKKVEEKKPQVKKEKLRPVVIDKKVTSKKWAVHIASYISKEEALSMAEKLKKDNYKAYITIFNLTGKQWYRVRVGFYASEREAKAAGKKLSNKYNISDIWTVKPSKDEIKSHPN